MTIQQAVETASLLRQEEHIAQNAAQASKGDSSLMVAHEKSIRHYFVAVLGF